MSVDMLNFAAPEVAEVVGSRKCFQSAAKSAGKQTLKKQFGGGSGQGRVIPTNSAIQIINNQVKQVSVANFLAVSENLGGKIPVFDDVLSCYEK